MLRREQQKVERLWDAFSVATNRRRKIFPSKASERVFPQYSTIFRVHTYCHCHTHFICAHKWIYFLLLLLLWVGDLKFCLCAELFLLYILFTRICVRISFDFMFTFLKPLFYRHSRRLPGFLSDATVFDSTSSLPLSIFLWRYLLLFICSLVKRESQKVVGGIDGFSCYAFEVINENYLNLFHIEFKALLKLLILIFLNRVSSSTTRTTLITSGSFSSDGSCWLAGS